MVALLDHCITVLSSTIVALRLDLISGTVPGTRKTAAANRKKLKSFLELWNRFQGAPKAANSTQIILCAMSALLIKMSSTDRRELLSVKSFATPGTWLARPLYWKVPRLETFIPTERIIVKVKAFRRIPSWMKSVSLWRPILMLQLARQVCL